LDALAVMTDTEVYNTLFKFCTAGNVSHVISALQKADPSQIMDPSFIETKPLHSKLHFIHEKGNKCRVIAIGDYYTQEALTPLHTTINDFLKSIKQDHTFNQDAGFEQILN